VRRAPNLASLVIFRIIQGATGGALQPLSQAVLLESFKPEERGRRWASGGSGSSSRRSSAGVGGWLTENYSWRWVFYINLPVGIISLLMTRAYVFRSAVLNATRRGSTTGAWGCWCVGYRRAAVRARQGAAGRTGSRTRPSRCSPSCPP
jgi:DHA2 family multidrug resistance protein